MADISDVEAALVTSIAATLYPNGTGSPSAVGPGCRVFRGWPDAFSLNSDLAAGIVNVSVFPRNGMTQNATRFMLTYTDKTIGPVTLTTTVSGQTVTIGGAAGAVQNVGIRTNAGAWAVTAGLSDAPATVAAALAAIVPSASVAGAVVTVPGPGLLARVGGFNAALLETRRQRQGFLLTVWAPTVALRDGVAALIDAALAPVEFLTLADGTGGRLIYHGTIVNDVPSKDALWRRDLSYTVEYPTTLAISAATMLFGGGDITSGVTETIVTTYGDIHS